MMHVVHADRLQWGGSLTAHRAGRMSHKILFQGEEGSPDNYLFVLANEGADYYSPRHRHAWDQVRLCLEGAVPIGRGVTIDAGEIGYFPEGVRYGPQEGGRDRIVLLLQIGGASGLGYLSPEQLRLGRERLLAEGAFMGGVFRRSSGEGKRNEDAYEAIWRAVTGRPLSYPKSCLKTPIILRPEGFTWRDVPGMKGVRRKLIGLFPQRGLSLELLAIERGSSYSAEPSATRRLLFARSGAGEANGEPFASGAAFRLEPGDSARFSATAAAELFGIEVSLLERSRP